jgi:hypothetical protein
MDAGHEATEVGVVSSARLFIPEAVAVRDDRIEAGRFAHGKISVLMGFAGTDEASSPERRRREAAVTVTGLGVEATVTSTVVVAAVLMVVIAESVVVGAA